MTSGKLNFDQGQWNEGIEGNENLGMIAVLVLHVFCLLMA